MFIYCYAISNNRLTIRSLQSARKNQSWVAHTGIILCLDWSPAHGLLVTGGEDGTYRVWTPQKRNVYTSRTLAYPVTSVKWAPSGEYFCVGLFNTIILCDQSGWQKHVLNVDSASILHLAFDHTGRTLAAAGARRTMLLCKVKQRPVRHGNFVVEQVDTNKVSVTDIDSDVCMDYSFFSFHFPFFFPLLSSLSLSSILYYFSLYYIIP